MRCVAILPGLLLMWSANAALAQVAGQVERMQQFNQQQVDTRIQTATDASNELAPELYEGESSDVGPQFIVRSKPRRKWVEATVDSQYYYTSNMLLTEQNPIDTTILVNTVQVAIAPTPFDMGGGQFAPRVGFRYQWYNYGMDNTTNQLNNFDFDVETLFTDLRYRFKDNWYVAAGFEWNRLLSHEGPTADYTEFYKEYNPSWTIGKFFPISDSMFFSMEYQGIYHLTVVDPLPAQNINDRIDHGVRLSFTQELIPNLYLQPYFRFLYTDYVNVNGSRNDYLFSVGTAFSYALTQWASVRTFVSYDVKESDDPSFADYTNVNAGCGVTLNVSF
ncbi:MAG: hypothetical protein B9S32_08785 [Verrucomicrobia bacterium Tous-C9LFEB]|nr:MAG: hypothetical protein B9S32_08785 [Verrucomicrobia bacterium Tous-C9LFEB]